jgi:hypothetical protein
MKKIISYSLCLSLTIGLLSSCGTYHSFNNAKTVSQLSGNPFMQQVAKSVMRNMANTLLQNGINDFGGKLNLGGNLNSLLSTARAVSGFKNMPSSKYNIANDLVESNFGSLTTVRDVVGFVAQNGSRFKF